MVRDMVAAASVSMYTFHTSENTAITSALTITDMLSFNFGTRRGCCHPTVDNVLQV